MARAQYGRGELAAIVADHKSILHRTPCRPARTLAGLAADFAAATARQERDDLTFAEIVVSLRGVLANLAGRYGAEVGAPLEPADVVDALREAVSRPLARAEEAQREIAGRIRSVLKTDKRAKVRHEAPLETREEEQLPPAPAPTPESGIDARRATKKIRPADRALLLAAAAYGYDHNELAKALGVTPGRVRVKLTEARARARKAIDDTHNT